MIDGLFSYSGSDQTNQVSSLLRKYLAEGDGWSYEKRTGLLEDLLSLERDPNWNGYFHYLCGAEKLSTQDYPGAVTCFLEADRQFDPLGANFADVSGPFCRNRFEIISEKWRDEGDDEKVIEYALSILAWKNDDTFSQYEEMVLLNCLGFALASLAEDKGLESLDRVALQVRLAALHYERANPDQLENLFLSYLAVKDRSGCFVVLEEMASVKGEEKRIEELKNLLAHHLQGGTDSGAPDLF